MKVNELIELLNKCDPNKEVSIYFDNGYGETSCDIVEELKEKVVISEEIL